MNPCVLLNAGVSISATAREFSTTRQTIIRVRKAAGNADAENSSPPAVGAKTLSERRFSQLP